MTVHQPRLCSRGFPLELTRDYPCIAVNGPCSCPCPDRRRRRLHGLLRQPELRKSRRSWSRLVSVRRACRRFRWPSPRSPAISCPTSGARSLVDVAKFTPWACSSTSRACRSQGRIYTAIRFRGLGSEIKEPFGQIGSAFLDGIYMSSGVSVRGRGEPGTHRGREGTLVCLAGSQHLCGRRELHYQTPRSAGVQRPGHDQSSPKTRPTTLPLPMKGPIIEDKLGYRVYLRGTGRDGQYVAI